jgi:phosphoribosylformylglycinamidine cyclo-ligase
MIEEYGDDWHNQIIPELGDLSLGRLVQAPSVIYSRFVSGLTGGYDIDKDPKTTVRGVAHITGGGQPSKLGRMLEPSGYGAVIDNPIEPPKIMKHVQELRGFDDETAYKKWHMGPGMVIATPEPDKVIEAAEEHSWQAKRIGEVTSSPELVIKSAGVEKPGRHLVHKQ